MTVPATAPTAGCTGATRPGLKTRVRASTAARRTAPRPDRPRRPRSRPVFGLPLRQLASDPSVPVEGGSCNDYDYTCGDPVNGSDLTGLCLSSISGRADLWILVNGQDTYCGLSYAPRVIGGKAGRIAVNENRDGCSAKAAVVLALGPKLGSRAISAFTPACQAHDYLYDVLRAEAARGALIYGLRGSADSIFSTLAGRVCGNTGYIGTFNKASCQIARTVFGTGLYLNTLKEGDPPR